MNKPGGREADELILSERATEADPGIVFDYFLPGEC